MTASTMQHVLFFLFATFSTGMLFGLSLLEENLGLRSYTFTTGCITFSVVGLILHLNQLNNIVAKIGFRNTIYIAVLIQEIGMTLAYFSKITAFSYIAAFLLAAGNDLVYSSAFFLYGEYKNFAVLLATAFTLSTMLFYITRLGKLYLLVIQCFLVLFTFIVRFPKNVETQNQNFKFSRFSYSCLLPISTFASCFSKNILTNLFFSVCQNQLIFTLGLAVSMLSGLLMFNVKIGFTGAALLSVIMNALYFANTSVTFIVAFYIGNLASSVLISATFSINAENGLFSYNSLCYLAMILGNCSGFLKNAKDGTKNAIFGIDIILSVVGCLGLIPDKQISQPTYQGKIVSNNSALLNKDELQTV